VQVEVLLGSARSIGRQASLDKYLLTLCKELCCVWDCRLVSDFSHVSFVSGKLTIGKQEYDSDAKYDSDQAFEEEEILPSTQTVSA